MSTKPKVYCANKHAPPAYTHQERGLKLSGEQAAFALLMEQGTGKTRVILDNFKLLLSQNNVNGLIVIAPNFVHENWVVEQLREHWSGPDVQALYWQSKRAKTKKYQAQLGNLVYSGSPFVFTINIDSLNTKAGNDYTRLLLNRHHGEVLLAVDESTRIKNPSAKRTKSILKLAPLAKYRRILTGTPINNNPFDVWAQFHFLDPAILRHMSFWNFKNYFGILKKKIIVLNGKKHEYHEVDSYRNLGELQAWIAPHSYRVTKDECLDIPPKQYQKIFVNMTEVQSTAYATAKKDCLIEIQDTQLPVTMALTRLLRLQQITGGYYPDDAGVALPIPGDNPKLQALIEIVKDLQGKCVIWCRYKAEIRAIEQQIRKLFGKGSVGTYYGDTIEDKSEMVAKFRQADNPLRFLLMSLQSCEGHNFQVARTAIYYSNSYSSHQREQSAARIHRSGQLEKTLFIDIVARGSIDVVILDTLQKKRNVALDILNGI